MLTLLTPYILGVLIQVGAIIGEKVMVRLPTTTPGSAATDQESFTKNLDTAQFLPSVLTITVGTLLVAPDMNNQATVIVLTLAVIVGVWFGFKLVRLSPSEYAALRWSLPSVSPLNLTMIVTNIILGAGVAATRIWGSEGQ